MVLGVDPSEWPVLIVPFMELKYAHAALHTCRHVGLNRTFYGIEIVLKLRHVALVIVLIVPFMELKSFSIFTEICKF